MEVVASFAERCKICFTGIRREAGETEGKETEWRSEAVRSTETAIVRVCRRAQCTPSWQGAVARADM